MNCGIQGGLHWEHAGSPCARATHPDHRPFVPPDAHSSGEPREIPSSEARANLILALADVRRSAARLEAAFMDYSGPEETLTESVSETAVEPPGDPE